MGRRFPGKLRPTLSVSPIYCDPQVEIRSRILGNDLIRADGAVLAKFVVDVDSGYFWRDDDSEVRSVARR